LIRVSNLTLARGATRLLEGANLTVHAGHKVGLVGPNGCGKSSLFALLRGELHADAGDVELPAAWTIAHVAQETPAVGTPALEFVLDGDRELRDVERALVTAERAAAADPEHGAALATLHHRFEEIGGYAARSRAATLLAGLGVPASRQHEPVAQFSGGLRMRLNLAQALMCRSDLLLLDEPTNHLDLDAVLWLEDWLARFPGTLLLVTHDRDFLDGVVDTIVHFDAKKLRAYAGNYTQFERERALQLSTQQAAYVKQQRQIAHLQSFVDRFRAKATKAKQVQSRIKALERMERIAAAHVDSPFEFAFAPVDTSARQLVRLDHVSLGYEDGSPPVLADVDWGVLAGERIGLLGPNGAGKSTLLRALAGSLAPRAGRRLTTQGLSIGYFTQHQVDQLDAGASPLAHLARLDPAAREQELRDYLGGFDFRGDMATADVARFSGGERARLALALIVRARPTLLLLDEPTNHLDIEMREALAEALQDYGGALVVVAHDRHLLRATADELWLVADGRLAPFDGDLDDYRDWVLSRGRGNAESAAESAPTLDRKAQKRAEAQARQESYARRKPLSDRLARIEQEIAPLDAERKELEGWLASPDAYTDDQRELLRERLSRQSDVTWQLARLETEWLEVSEALEKLE